MEGFRNNKYRTDMIQLRPIIETKVINPQSRMPNIKPTKKESGLNEDLMAVKLTPVKKATRISKIILAVKSENKNDKTKPKENLGDLIRNSMNKNWVTPAKENREKTNKDDDELSNCLITPLIPKDNHLRGTFSPSIKMKPVHILTTNDLPHLYQDRGTSFKSNTQSKICQKSSEPPSKPSLSSPPSDHLTQKSKTELLKITGFQKFPCAASLKISQFENHNMSLRNTLKTFRNPNLPLGTPKEARQGKMDFNEQKKQKTMYKSRSLRAIQKVANTNPYFNPKTSYQSVKIKKFGNRPGPIFTKYPNKNLNLHGLKIPFIPNLHPSKTLPKFSQTSRPFLPKCTKQHSK
ncbi:unnamed protein product [Moneuplotes crassus]|uniref:Uncharacterized protein n=1 Tax=Euplotes crassus TaxID=5936 RepID=A0AAD1UJL3_EUPCR|nr:unnamed protein product [Moneuplotes crassus]